MRLLVTLLWLLVGAPLALAHGLSMTLVTANGEVRGQVAYSTGTPAAGEWVAIYQGDGGGEPIEQLQTDASGRFSLPLDAGMTYRIVALAEEGHEFEARIDMPEDTSVRVETTAQSTAHGGLPPEPILVGLGALIAIAAAVLMRKRLARRD